MIARALILVLGTAAAYPLLRGLPQGWPALVRVGLATGLLLPALGYWLWPGAPGLARAHSRQTVGWLDRLALGTVMAATVCGFMWLLCAAPEPLESLSLALEQQMRPQAAAAPDFVGRDGGAVILAVSVGRGPSVAQQSYLSWAGVGEDAEGGDFSVLAASRSGGLVARRERAGGARLAHGAPGPSARLEREAHRALPAHGVRGDLVGPGI